MNVALFALMLTIVVYTGRVTVWLSVKLQPPRLIMIFAPGFWDLISISWVMTKSSTPVIGVTSYVSGVMYPKAATKCVSDPIGTFAS